MSTPLSRDFFTRSTVTVAKDLLGKIIVFGNTSGYITETEAYIGHDDPACHAARGKTPRNAVMFGPAGFSYVYFIYGMYHCLNFVTEEEGKPAAVLIRGLQLMEPESLHLDGPGKLCRHWGLTREHNGIDVTGNGSLTVMDSSLSFPFSVTPRIGITKGQEKLWRFVVRSEE